jgi:phosphoribosylaminoimidazole-succinocarboxamide synthase
MALPRFSFSGGATEFFQPNQALFRTTFTPSDKLQSDTYQAEAKAYKDAVEKYNEALKVNPEVARLNQRLSRSLKKSLISLV